MKPRGSAFGQALLFVRQGISLENNFPKTIKSVTLIFACNSVWLNYVFIL